MGVSRVLVAPAGIPDEVCDRLLDAIEAISDDETMIRNFEGASLPYNYMGHEALEEQLERQNEVYIRLIEENREQFAGN